MPKSNSRKSKAVSKEYKLPKTAAELDYNCALCGRPAEWFDYERGRDDLRQGILCGACPRSINSAKLLVKKSDAHLAFAPPGELVIKKA